MGGETKTEENTLKHDKRCSQNNLTAKIKNQLNINERDKCKCRVIVENDFRKYSNVK